MLSTQDDCCRRCKRTLPEDALYCPTCGAKQQVQQRQLSKRANGTGTAVKRPGSQSWTVYVVMGYDAKTQRAIRRSKGGFPTKTAALAYAPVLKGLPSSTPHTVAHYHQLWQQGADLSKSRRVAYRIAWDKLKPIHNQAIGAMQIAGLQALINETASSHYTARDMRTVLSHLFKLAVADGQARVNLASFITIPSLNEEEAEPFTEEEILRIWLAYDAGSTMCGYMLLMIYTGMMPGELLQLLVSSIDRTERIIRGAGLKTKERKRKALVLPLAIMEVIDELEKHAADGKLYPHNKDTFYKHYRATIAQLEGVRPLPPYSCRHTTGTALALSASTPPALVQRVMRHSKYSSTEKYIHPDYVSARDAIDAAMR